MEKQNQPEIRSTLYVDVDGVLLPHFGMLTDVEYAQTPNGELSRKQLNTFEFFHPEVIQALGEVASRSLVISSSSRMKKFLHDPTYDEIIETVGIEAALTIDYVRPSSIDLKLDAVRRHWTGVGDEGLRPYSTGRGRGNAYSYCADIVAAQGERAVLVDDHIFTATPRQRQQLARLEDHYGITVVSPSSPIGLTLEDVELIGRKLQGQ